MEHIEKQILIIAVEVIFSIVVGYIAWQSYGDGIGELSSGIILLVLMLSNYQFFGNAQEWIFVISYGVASLLLTAFGVLNITSGDKNSGLYSIISAIVIFVIMLFVLIYTISEEK